MKKSFKVNLEKFKDEDDLNLFLDFIERNKNKIKIIHTNKITSLKNEKKSKIKLILLNNTFNYQSYQIKYSKRKSKFKKEEDELEEDMGKDNIKIFGKEFVKNNYSKCFIMYKDIYFH